MNTNRPTLGLIGDSTVRNGRSDGAGGLWGWGDWLAPHFDTKDYFVNEHTHTSKAGAQCNAWVVALAVGELRDCKLKEFLITGK